MIATETQIKIERSFDQERIKSLLINDKIWFNSIDDFSETKENFTPFLNENLNYLIISKENKDIGFALFIPHSEIMYEIHIGFLSDVRECGKLAINWVFENTDCLKIIARMPEINKIVINFSVKMGFKKEGVLTKAFKKFNKLHDLHIYSLNKGVL